MPENEWLVRTARNILLGPFPRERICKMIQSRELVPEDEICVANGYWFYLHERAELYRQLGMELPKELTEDRADATATQTEWKVDRTDPQLESFQTQIAQRPREKAIVETPFAARNSGQRVSARQFERRSWWYLTAFFLLLSGLGLVYSMIRLLRA